MKPNPSKIFPVHGVNSVTHIKPTITRANIIVGEFSYYAGRNFEQQVTHHYEFIGDKLIIGKFCQIASGVEFVMNGANHQMNCASTFPFYIFEGWKEDSPKISDLPLKGDTVIGNDVWIGQNSVILPGVHIGDGAIIGLNSVVGSDIPPYVIAAGNPAGVIRKRFDDELIDLLLKLKWWDKTIDEIQSLIPLLTCSDLERVKHELRELITAKPRKKYKLMGADGNFYESDTPGQYGGNSKYKIYGRLDCPSALSTIKRFPGVYEKSRVFFADERTALAADYRPCGNCLREKYRQYKADPENYKARFERQ